MLRTKLSLKINKGQLLHKYDGQSYDPCALHFSLMGSIHLCSFKMIPEILFELCSRQKCGLQTDRPTERPTDRPTSAKQYTPSSSKGGGGIINNSALK